MSLAEFQDHQKRHGFLQDFAPQSVNGEVRKTRRAMNKTEYEFSLILEAMRRRKEIVSYSFEGITLRLADGCKYTPDFFIVVSNIVLRLRFVEVKGKMIWDDSKVKFRVAREQNPWAEWEAWQKTKEKGWQQIM